MTTPCGTYGAYQRHMKKDEPVDDACRTALNEYMAKFRRTNPESIKRARRTTKIRGRALSRLAHAHPEEYQRLLSDEYRREPQT